MGYGEKTFARKMQVLWHQCCVIFGTPMSLRKFRSSILGVSSDQASTERKIPNAPNISQPGDVTAALDSIDLGDGIFENLANELFYFPNAMGCTDPMHMIWNCFESSIKADQELWQPYERRLRGILLFWVTPKDERGGFNSQD